MLDTLLMLAGGVLLVGVVVGAVSRSGDRAACLAPQRDWRGGPEHLIAPVLAYLAATVLLYPVVNSLIGTTAGSVDVEETREASVDFAAVLVNNAAMIAGALACWWVGRRCVATSGRPFVLDARDQARGLGEGVVGVMIALAACQATLYATVWLIERFDPTYAFAEHDVIDALRDPASPAWFPVAMWIGVAMVTPIAEECFFRGLMQTVLAKVLRRRVFAVVLASVFFGMAHSSQPHVVPAITVFGVILGTLYERRGSLLGPIVAHALFNAKTLLWETFRAG